MNPILEFQKCLQYYITGMQRSIQFCTAFYLQIFFNVLWNFSLYSVYPPITSDIQRQEYKREFDSDLRKYKKMCAEMDNINNQLQQLSKQLDRLTDGTAQYQVHQS